MSSRPQEERRSRADGNGRYRATHRDFGWEASMLARALEIVAEGLHVPVSAEDARSAATSDGGDLDAWAERAASAARTVGLHVHADPRPPEPAPQLGPAFTRIEPGVWLVVRGSRRRRVRVT